MTTDSTNGRTKHQPATPLPWAVVWGLANYLGIYGGHPNEPRKNIVRTNMSQRNKEDAAYIAHACNAYPRLVEALKGLRGYRPSPDAIASTDALLRELGEL